MHLEVWISMASAAVTVVAAGVAGWQAREARRQARAAEDQVREARRSATAAEEQVELMRCQHEAYQAERDERDAERCKREMELASLITIEVDYSDYQHPDDMENPVAWVVIINQGEQAVRRPQVESMGDTGLVHLGPQVSYGDEEPYSPPELLLPHTTHYVPFEHVDARGRSINPDKSTIQDFDECVDADGIFRGPRTAATSPIKKRVDADDVTITFIDLSGVRWERTGNGVPVRVVQPSSRDGVKHRAVPPATSTVGDHSGSG